MPTCHVPITVRLSGDPARVPADVLTASVERAVTGRLGQVRRELLARSVVAREAAVVIGEPASTPAERVEATRLAGSEYELRSFDDGARTRVPVQSVDPVEGARRALVNIHRQLETGLFDWSVSRDEAREVLRILSELRGETLLRTVQMMRLSGAWRTFRRALGDAAPDALLQLELRIDPNIGILALGDRIQVEMHGPHGVDPDYSQEYDVTRAGVEVLSVPRPVPVVGLTPAEAANAIATAYFDALVFTEPSVNVGVSGRGYNYAPSHGAKSPIFFRSTVSFGQTPAGQRAQRTAAFVDYVRELPSADPVVARALHHYFTWVERSSGTPDFSTREPADLWRWALRQAGETPRPSPLEAFLSFQRHMQDQAANSPSPEYARRTQATLGRFVAWVDRHRDDPDLGSRDPGEVWSRLWIGALEEDIRQERLRRARAAEEQRSLVNWGAAQQKLEAALALVRTRILPVRETEAIDVPDEEIGYLITPSRVERLVRNRIADGYLRDLIGRMGDLDFTRTTATEDLTNWLARNPELQAALRVSAAHPEVEHYTVVVDVPAWEIAVEVGIGFIPIVGQAVAGAEVLSGYSLTGRRLSTLERGILAAAILLPAAARLGRLGYAAAQTSRMASMYRMSAVEAEAFFRATAQIRPGTAGSRALSRALDDVRAGRPITDQQQVRELETLMRDMGMTDSATARVLETRAAGTGPISQASDAEIEAILNQQGWTRPTVTGGQRPRIAGIRVPTRRTAQLGMEDIARAAGEAELQALDRVERLIYRRIDQTPLAEAWQAARDRVLAGRQIENITREQMLGRPGRAGIYDRVRDEFWTEVRRRPDVSRWLNDAGFDLRDGLAPTLRVNRPGIPVEETRVSLDHILEKAQGENWRRAIDADNLRFEFQTPNAYREIVQSRFRLRSATPPAALPGSGPPPTPDSTQGPEGAR